MRALQDPERWRATIPLPHRVKTRITCTAPGEDETHELAFSTASVTANSGTGRRKTASTRIAPVYGTDLYERLAAPGSIFNIWHGFDYGSTEELLPVFTGEAASAVSPLADGSVDLSLTDMWQRVERARFLDLYNPAAGTRSATVAAAMLGALGSAPTDLTTLGGNADGTKTWERDRAAMIREVASDGALVAYVDSDGLRGTIVTREVPTLDPGRSVATIRSGPGGTLKGGSRTRPLDRLYNCVVAYPVDETQTWARQVARIEDPNHPRHASKIGGDVPYFLPCPTVLDAPSALLAAQARLSTVIGVTTTLSLDAIGDASLEPGDVVKVLKSGPLGQRVAVVHLIDGWTLDCVAGSMSMDTRSASVVEEAA